jgi:hypothetical protein
VETQWLQDLFNTVTDVKLATPYLENTAIFQHHNAHLVVNTWMGGVLYVYLLEKAPKVRELRGILRDNSRTGIGTLFIVQQPLLPEAGKEVALVDWHDALRSMSDGWIYSYTAHNTLEQIHFNPTPNPDKFYCWHLTDFAIENVSVRRRSINGNLKGDWFIGDIASPAFKRRVNTERQNQRYHYHTHTQPKEKKIAPADELTKHYQMLGISNVNASEKEVKAAFRQMALRVHPDVSALPRNIAEEKFKELNRAYEFIKDYHGWN